MRLGWRSNPYLVYRYFIIMRIVKLVHPQLGVCAQEVSDQTESIKNKWKARYGKKFNECKVVIENDKPKFKERKVVNLITGDIYDSPHQASKELGLSITTIRTHLNRNLSPQSSHLYLVKWG